MSLLILFSVFTSSWPAALLGNDGSLPNDSQKASIDDLLENILADNSNGNILIGSEFDSKVCIIRPATICYEDIKLFLLWNPNNPE